MSAGTILKEGHNKIVWATEDPNRVCVQFKDESSHLSRIINNVYGLLQECPFPTSYHKNLGVGRYLADKCQMIPGSVEAHRETVGNTYSKLIVKMEQAAPDMRDDMDRFARMAFLVMEKAWQLKNLKFHFGFNTSGQLVLADLMDIDCRDTANAPFDIPLQQIILCQESEEEDLRAVYEQVAGSMRSVKVTVVKDGDEAKKAIQEIADTVVFTRTNNAKQFFMNKTIVPVIAISNREKTEEGIQNALRVLAFKNPLLHMYLKLAQDT